MSGCYGNSQEDRHFENKLMEYLDQFDIDICPKCAQESCEWCADCNNHNCECECEADFACGIV